MPTHPEVFSWGTMFPASPRESEPISKVTRTSKLRKWHASSFFWKKKKLFKEMDKMISVVMQLSMSPVCMLRREWWQRAAGKSRRPCCVAVHGEHHPVDRAGNGGGRWGDPVVPLPFSLRTPCYSEQDGEVLSWRQTPSSAQRRDKDLICFSFLSLVNIFFLWREEWCFSTPNAH